MRAIVLGAGVATVVLGAGVPCSAHAQDAVRAGSVHGSVIDAATQQPLPGAAIVALRSSVPVLPIAVTGSGRLQLPGMFLRLDRHLKVTLTIGKPFQLEKPQRLNAEAAREGTRQIMEHIAALLPPQNRGYYEYVTEQVN